MTQRRDYIAEVNKGSGYSSLTICISLNFLPENVYSISFTSVNPMEEYSLRATVFSKDTLTYRY